MNSDAQRLESERLRPVPPWPPVVDDVGLWRELIGLIYQAIRDDQRRGTWGNRGRR